MPANKPLRLLVTNDDGIDSPGLAALEAALPDSAESIVVAPAEEQSGCSHQVTTAQGFRALRCAEGRFAVNASPADCIRIAVHSFRTSFDWVLAGINHGANLGADIYYSGTVAAAREAALHGIPAIALSHYRNRVLSPQDWRRATSWARRLIPHLIDRPLNQGEYWNVNLPSLAPGPADPEMVDCEVDTRPLPLVFAVDGDCYHYAGRYHRRGRQGGRDVEICFGGKIAVSLLTLP